MSEMRQSGIGLSMIKEKVKNTDLQKVKFIYVKVNFTVIWTCGGKF